ncbi:MAG: hypothetical protein LBT92_00515 [Rickettsiales bacterium]|jgi:hypothetical protein|nr:hypothetical protein [Rickettsiales bacterium]
MKIQLEQILDKGRIVLDLDGVVRESLARHIVKWGAKRIQPSLLLSSLIGYKLIGRISRKGMDAIAPFFHSGAVLDVRLIDGAEEAVKTLLSLYPGRVHICSNSSFGPASDDAVRDQLCGKFGQGAFAEIALLPLDESKRSYFNHVKLLSGDNGFIVFDDDRKKLVDARKAGGVTVLIKKPGPENPTPLLRAVNELTQR